MKRLPSGRAVGRRQALVERHRQRQVEGVGRRVALDLGARRDVALDRRLRLLERDVEADRDAVVDDLVLGAERLRPVAEDARVDPREVAEVDEVLDPAGGRAGPVVGGNRDGPEARLLPPRRGVGEGIGGSRLLPATRPGSSSTHTRPTATARRVARHASAIRNGPSVHRRDPPNHARPVVAPAVVRADEARLANRSRSHPAPAATRRRPSPATAPSRDARTGPGSTRSRRPAARPRAARPAASPESAAPPAPRPCTPAASTDAARRCSRASPAWSRWMSVSVEPVTARSWHASEARTRRPPGSREAFVAFRLAQRSVGDRRCGFSPRSTTRRPAQQIVPHRGHRGLPAGGASHPRTRSTGSARRLPDRSRWPPRSARGCRRPGRSPST